MYGSMDRCMDVWMGGCADGSIRMDECMDGSMDAWMNV